MSLCIVMFGFSAPTAAVDRQEDALIKQPISSHV